MTTVAEALKCERETQGISLDEVAQKTYIKLHYLHALEEDRPDLLPAPVYTCGYIRQYAKLLGLNGADLVNIYQQQHKPREYSIVRNVSPALAPESKVESRAGEGAGVATAPMAAVFTEPEPFDEPAETLSRPVPVVIAEPAAPAQTRPAAMGNPLPFSPALSTAPPPAQPVARPMASSPSPTLVRPSAGPAPIVEPVAKPSPKPMPNPQSNQLEVRIDTRDALLSHPEAEKILILARQQAEEILLRAREEAARLRQGAEQYADQILMQLETDVSRTLAVIKNGRSHLQTRTRSRRSPERPGERERSTEATSS